MEAVGRVEAKAKLAIENKKEKPHFIPWLNVFAAEQRKFAIEALMPIVKTAEALGRRGLNVEQAAARYEAALKGQKFGTLETFAKEIFYAEEK